VLRLDTYTVKRRRVAPNLPEGPLLSEPERVHRGRIARLLQIGRASFLRFHTVEKRAKPGSAKSLRREGFRALV